MSNTMENSTDWPRKVLLGDLPGRSPLLKVWVQGSVTQTVGSDILILSDGSGRAKVTHCSTADGPTKCLSKGVYCCVIGTAVTTTGLPEIHATKLVDLKDNPAAADAWADEVREAMLVLDNKIKPVA